MAAANVTWAAPRIHGELLKLGFEISERTVSRLMPKRTKKPSQTWKTFLTNHVGQLVSIDFFTVSTLQLGVLFVFVVLAHERRRLVHFNVTEHPTAEWTAQQVIEAFPEDAAPRYLIRDRDGVYGRHFRNRVEGMGIQEVLTAAQSPWQNPFVERLIGSFVVHNKRTVVAIPVMWRRRRWGPSAVVPLGLVRNINCFGLLYSSSSVLLQSRADLNTRAQLARSRLSRPPQHLRPAGTGNESKSHRSL